uniref:GNNC2999 n=1 Tax=Homo sapiens TaxID=9606 RepID=Q6UWM8_HUMAN|nr:GNNC2999 [Homo sapiens]
MGNNCYFKSLGAVILPSASATFVVLCVASVPPLILLSFLSLFPPSFPSVFLRSKGYNGGANCLAISDKTSLSDCSAHDLPCSLTGSGIRSHQLSAGHLGL